MTTKKTTKSTSSEAHAPKNYKITTKHLLGPYASMEVVNKVKYKLKSNLKGTAQFTAVKRTPKGFFFGVAINYKKSIAAPKAHIHAHLKKHSPRAKITVTQL